MKNSKIFNLLIDGWENEMFIHLKSNIVVFVEPYEPFSITGDIVVLYSDPNHEIRIPVSDIENISVTLI